MEKDKQVTVRLEYKTTQGHAYASDSPPSPSPPGGEGWRMVGSAVAVGSGVYHFWYWAREVR